MSKSYGDQTFLSVFREIAREKGIDPDSDKAKDARRDIHDYELEPMELAEKDSLYQDVRELKSKMRDWIDEHYSFENQEDEDEEED